MTSRRELLGAIVGGVVGYGLGLLIGSQKPVVQSVVTHTVTQTVAQTVPASSPFTIDFDKSGNFIRWESGKKRVVVVGGGPAGAAFVNRLVQLVPPDKISILVIDKNVYWLSGPEETEIAQGEATFQGAIGVINSLGDGKTVRVVNAEVGWVDPDSRVVYTNVGAVEYDYLFVGTGMVFADWEVPGLAQAPNLSIYYGKTALAYYHATERLKKGVVVIGIPKAPYKCGPAPFETAFMTYERLKKKGADFKIVMLDANPQPAPGPDARRRIFLDFIKRTEGAIEYHTNEYIARVDPLKKTLESTKGESYSWDVLMVIGPTHAPDWLIAAGLAKRFVDVDRKTFRHVKYDDVYSAGDAQGFTNYGYAVGSGTVAAESLARDLGYEPKDPTTVISNENYNNLYGGYFVHIKLQMPVGGQEQGQAELVQGEMYKNIRLGWIKATTSIYKERF